MLRKIKKYIKSHKTIYKWVLKWMNVWNKILFFFKYGSYDPKKYWEKRWKTFIQESYQLQIHDSHYWVLSKIKKYKPKTILEIGCWFWRNIKFLKDNLDFPFEITGIDISQELICQAKSFLDQYQGVELEVSDILSLDISKEFDLVLIHGVFMHIPFNGFLENRRKLYTLNYKHLIEVEEVVLDERWMIKTENINGYTFSHNYLNLDENIVEKDIKNNLLYLDISHV